VSGHGHHKTVCSCGAVISQCRCANPEKRVNVVPNGCPACGGGRIPFGKASGGLAELAEQDPLVEACILLRRAAERLTTAAANVLAAPPEDYQVIDDIGAYLARVDPNPGVG
jgi:hypothetical protein